MSVMRSWGTLLGCLRYSGLLKVFRLVGSASAVTEQDDLATRTLSQTGRKCGQVRGTRRKEAGSADGSVSEERVQRRQACRHPRSVPLAPRGRLVRRIANW